MKLNLAADQPWRAHGRSDCRDLIYGRQTALVSSNPEPIIYEFIASPALLPPPDGGRLQEASPFSLLTLDIVQLCSLLLQLGLERLRLRLQVGQSLVQLYLLCGHFRELRGSHKFSWCGRRSATKRLKAELTADAAVMTSEGEDAPPVYGGGRWGGWSASCCCGPISRYNTALVETQVWNICSEHRCSAHGPWPTDVAAAGDGMRRVTRSSKNIRALIRDITFHFDV